MRYERLETRWLMTTDLVPTSLVGPAIGSLEQAIDLTMQIENQGQSDSNSFMVRYYVSLDATLDNKDRLIGSESRPALAANSIEDQPSIIEATTFGIRSGRA